MNRETRPIALHSVRTEGKWRWERSRPFESMTHKASRHAGTCHGQRNLSVGAERHSARMGQKSLLADQVISLPFGTSGRAVFCSNCKVIRVLYVTWLSART